ncbi:hypothetical protein CH371_19415 [Leptospira wolffii]|uniref:Uncharacterized protein n=1 Tax=Leptospira wolffii TaxID=409998 RepID=A0A2M9Z768_9LEPT|nr:hypothetical protein CH371_19415 [Leptospira wolffii]
MFPFFPSAVLSNSFRFETGPWICMKLFKNLNPNSQKYFRLLFFEFFLQRDSMNKRLSRMQRGS